MMWVSCFTRELRQLLRNIRATVGKSGVMRFFIGDKAYFPEPLRVNGYKNVT